MQQQLTWSFGWAMLFSCAALSCSRFRILAVILVSDFFDFLFIITHVVHPHNCVYWNQQYWCQMKLVKRLTPYLFLLLLHGLNPGHVLQHDRVYAPCVTTCLPLSHTHTHKHPMYCSMIMCVPTCLLLTHTHTNIPCTAAWQSLCPLCHHLPAPVTHTHTNIPCTATWLCVTICLLLSHKHTNIPCTAAWQSMSPVSWLACSCHPPTHANIPCTVAWQSMPPVSPPAYSCHTKISCIEA